MDEMRGKAAISDAEKQRLEAQTEELQRGLLLWAERKEELMQQAERGRRELETRCAGQSGCHTSQPLCPQPQRGPCPHQAGSGGT